MQTVIILESKVIDSAYLKLMFQRSGWNALAAPDMPTVRQLLEEHPHCSLVFLDESSLGKQLHASVQELRARELQLGLPMVLAITTNFSIGNNKRHLSMGADFAPSKPLYNDVLLQIMQQVQRKLKARAVPKAETAASCAEDKTPIQKTTKVGHIGEVNTAKEKNTSRKLQAVSE